MAAADSVLRATARSAEANSRRSRKIVIQHAFHHPSRYLYPGNYIQSQ